MKKLPVYILLGGIVMLSSCTSPDDDSRNSAQEISLAETTTAQTTAAEKLYKVDLCGREYDYEDPKTEYAAGDTVRLHFDVVATDTDYNFFLDDESIEFKVEYDGVNGFYIIFTMPDHDVKVDYRSRNTMEPPDDPEEEENIEE